LICTKCKYDKKRIEFRLDKSTKSGLYPWCNDCVKIQSRSYYNRNRETIIAKASEYQKTKPEVTKRAQKKWRDSNKDTIRNNQWLRKFGLTTEQVESMFSSQGGHCAICKNPNIKLCVDHDHTTNKIRGILCSKCNSAIGLLQDSAEVILAAYNYLKEHNNF
jgi:hypothetical protein